MRAAFEADLLTFVESELKKLNVVAPNRDVTGCALLLFKLQRRCPVATPRRTECAASFSVPADLKNGFDGLCLAIHQGQPLLPYLSRSTFSIDKADGLLDDWGILHFHLGTERLLNGLIKGTKTVAFGLVQTDCIYFLDALPHGPGHGDVWVREKLIHTIEENWPSLLPSNSRSLTPDTLTAEERANCRKKSLNVSVWPSHLPNSSIKDDGVRVFLSGRDCPYRQDFHAPTKLLSQTIQSPGRPGMPATWGDNF